MSVLSYSCSRGDHGNCDHDPRLTPPSYGVFWACECSCHERHDGATAPAASASPNALPDERHRDADDSETGGAA